MTSQRPFALVTGASLGIGYELARLAAEDGYDLLIAADRETEAAARKLRALGGSVEALEVDLATTDGVERLYATARGRPIDLLFANAGHGLGHAFLDQDFAQARHVVDTNITGTIALIHKIGRDMRARGVGRILITGSIAGFMPGSFQAVYNGTKAFIDSFGWALRNELEGSGVTVTILMPGATETAFFERAQMLDTKIGTTKKDDPAFVARVGYDAMMKGEGDVVAGWKNNLQSTAANFMPAALSARMHRREAEPGTGRPQAGGNGYGGTAAAAKMLLGVAAGAAGLWALSSVLGRRSEDDHERQSHGRPGAPAASDDRAHAVH